MASAAPARPSDRPDIVIFMTDQQRGVTVDPGHALKADTPRLDAFAASATRFSRCHAPSPHCCPSRASFFTGLYPSEHGVWNNVNVPNALSRGPRPGTPFWSEAFVAAGYDLAFSGKWHVSATEGPSGHGWRELHPIAGLTPPVGAEEQRRRSSDDRIDALRSRPVSRLDDPRGLGEVIRPGWPRFTLFGTDEDPFGDADVVRHAVSELSRPRDDDAPPTMLFVGTLGPHDPYIPPQRFLDRYDPATIELPASFTDPMTDKPRLYQRTRDRFDQLTEAEHREALRSYLAFCSYEDELFGQVLDAIDASGRADRTIVVYLSDHGDYTAEHGLWGKGLPSFEPAYHVPLLIRAPGQASRVVDERVSLLDIGPTLAELSGVTIEATSGASLAPAIAGETLGDRVTVSQSNGNEVYGIQRIVRHGRWKLVMNLFDDDELYDLDSDPDELTNLLARTDRTRRVGVEPLAMVPQRYRRIVEELYGLLWAHGIEHDDDLTNPYILTALASFGPMAAFDDEG